MRRRRLRRRAVLGESVSRTGFTPSSSSVETWSARASSTRIAPGLGVLARVVGDHAIADADGCAQFVLGEAARLTQRGEAGAKACEGPLLHVARTPREKRAHPLKGPRRRLTTCHRLS